MRKTAFLIIGLLILSANCLLAQKSTNSLSKWTLQATGSYAFAYQYKQPDIVFGCFECRQPISQTVGYSKSFHFEINRELNSNSSINVGFGRTINKIKQRALNSLGGGPSNYIVDLQFTSYNIGYKSLYAQTKNFNFFTEHRLFLEIPMNSFRLRTAMSYQVLSGIIYDWSHSLKFLVSPYFKTALMDHSSRDNGYFPFSFGLDIGILFNLQKSESFVSK